MKIDHIGPSKLVKNYGNQDNKAEKGDRGKKKDSLSLSGKVKDLQKVKNKINYTPQIRQEKVSNLKKQIKQGAYNVKGEEIAGKILDQIVNKKA